MYKLSKTGDLPVLLQFSRLRLRFEIAVMSSVETAHGHTDYDDTQVVFGPLLYFTYSQTTQG